MKNSAISDQNKKMYNTPKVIDTIIRNDLCIGCGLCVYSCPSKALEMQWNDYGFLVPEITGNCDLNGDCLSICPFNPFPEKDLETENELAELFLKSSDYHHPKIGKYNGIYVGYSNEFRLTSSSGGLATYIFTELIEKGIVNHIFSVKASAITGTHYEYSISSTKEDLLTASKTKYFPVTLGTVLPKIHELEGKIAIVGVACFIKAIRLAQNKEPDLKEKIPFLVGIICGGVKSRFFTEYLAGKAGVSIENIQQPQFRMKDLNSTSDNYSFGCYDRNGKKEKTVKMRSVGNMWGTGLFKANACDFCDDVTTELADISLGDAWIPPYNKDGKGTSVIVTRSSTADKLIQYGIKKSKLAIEELSLEQFLDSQQGSFNHRQTGLSVRIKQAKKKNKVIPPKRFGNERVTFEFKMVQKLRMKIRKNSLEIWRNKPDSRVFDEAIKNHLLRLQFATGIYHKITRIYDYRKAINRRIRILTSKLKQI